MYNINLVPNLTEYKTKIIMGSISRWWADLERFFKDSAEYDPRAEISSRKGNCTKEKKD